MLWLVILIWPLTVLAVCGGLGWLIYAINTGELNRRSQERDIQWRIKMVQIQKDAANQLEKK